MLQLPNEFEKRMRALLSGDYASFVQALNEAPKRAFRLNRLKAGDALSPSQLPGCGDKVPYAENCYYFEQPHIGSHPLHHAGAIYVQEPAAMAPISAVQVEQSWTVLDLCASPGGKSGQLAALIGEEGTLLSNEYTQSRCRTLISNLERLGVRNAIVTNADGAQIAANYRSTFDLTVVDAPCSGEGMFRKNELAAAQWTAGGVDACAKRQRTLLSQAAQTVKPGGLLIYSTCTFEICENEEQVAALLAERSDFTLIPPKTEVVEASSPGVAVSTVEFALSEAQAALCRRFYPHISGGEGQFLAVFRRSDSCAAEENGLSEKPFAYPCPAERLNAQTGKGKRRSDGRGGNREADLPRPLTQEEARLCGAFFAETLTEAGVLTVTPRLTVWNGAVWAVGAKLPMPNEGLCCPGVCVGMLQGGRLVPHHHFFSAYGQYFRRRIDLNPENEGENRLLSAYLHGDVIPVSFDGWGVVTVCGCPLGGLKSTNGVGKNHYPKGLRRFE